jgi:hypothetical protein
MATGLVFARLPKGGADTVLTWDMAAGAPKWTAAATTDASAAHKGLTRDAIDALHTQLSPALLPSAPGLVADKGKLLSTKLGALLLETPAFIGGGVGATGAQGPDGLGSKGDTGAAGVAGNAGATGATGGVGVQGATGLACPTKGATGPVGPAGGTGETGVTGPTGPATWRGRYSAGALYPTPVSDTSNPAAATAGIYDAATGELRVLADDPKDYCDANTDVVLNVGSLVGVSMYGSYLVSTRKGFPIAKWTLYGSVDGATGWATLDDRTDRDYGLDTEGHWHEVPYTALHSDDLKYQHFKLSLGARRAVRLAVRYKHS